MSVQSVETLFGAAIKFIPDLSNDAFSIYAVTAYGGKHVFDVVVNNLTRDMKICFADTTEIELDKKVAMRVTIDENGSTSRPSATSVKSIIYPRIIGLLVDKMSG